MALQQVRIWKSLVAVNALVFVVGCGPGSEAGVQVGDEISSEDRAFYDFDTEGPEVDVAEEAVEPETDLGTLSGELTEKQSAVAWFRNRKGSRSYEQSCELAVERAFGTRGRYGSATSNWNAQVNAGRAHRDRSPPYGALVFWASSRPQYGHVAISDGQGGVWSTSVGGKIGYAKLSYFKGYRGWAQAPAAW